MSPPTPAENEAHEARKDHPNAQARKLLRTLCDIILPLVQPASGESINAKKIRFGKEADKFSAELEKFIAGMISRSRPRNQDITIKATLNKDWLDNFEGTNWLWEIPAPDDKAINGPGAIAEREVTLGSQTPIDQSVFEHQLVVPKPRLRGRDDKGLQSRMQDLRRHVTQKMPIRLLCFEPHNGKLKIFLFENAQVYDYLAPKLQAAYYNGTLRYIKLREWYESAFGAGYAILSHTWNQTPGELTYGDWQNGLLDDTHPKCQKLVNFCKAAWENHGITLGWIDTVCINKESSSELDESIRSMYSWYHNASVCITYLAGTSILSDMHKDPWFSRGWTFQELVAPHRIRFYSKDWNWLSNSKDSLWDDKEDPSIQAEITLRMKITPDELIYIKDIPISRRMELAAMRQVTREEDIAYCLMGIFDISISTAYGEGAGRAFARLVEEIIRSTKDISDIFNWAGGHEYGSRKPTSSLFPSSPSNYLSRLSNEKLRPWRPMAPLILTHLGLRTPILLMCAVPISKSVLETDHQPIGDYQSTISIPPILSNYAPIPRKDRPENYHLLDKRFLGPEGLYTQLSRPSKKMTLTCGILNVEQQGSGTIVHIPKTCLAVLLELQVDPLSHQPVTKTSSPDYKKLYTETPVVFDLHKIRTILANDRGKEHYALERSDLKKHGMRLEILYL